MRIIFTSTNGHPSAMQPQGRQQITILISSLNWVYFIFCTSRLLYHLRVHLPTHRNNRWTFLFLLLLFAIVISHVRKRVLCRFVMITFVCGRSIVGDRMWNVAESKIPNRLLHDKTETELMRTGLCRLSLWLLCFFTATTRHRRLAPILSCSPINPYLSLCRCLVLVVFCFFFGTIAHSHIEWWTVDRLVFFFSFQPIPIIHSFVYSVWFVAMRGMYLHCARTRVTEAICNYNDYIGSESINGRPHRHYKPPQATTSTLFHFSLY